MREIIVISIIFQKFRQSNYELRHYGRLMVQLFPDDRLGRLNENDLFRLSSEEE